MNLNIALRTNRILLYSERSPPGQHFIESPMDNDERNCGRSLNCVFEPLSTCPFNATSDVNTVVLPPYKALPDVYVGTSTTSVPPVLGYAMKMLDPDITLDALKYWWRMQASAYIMRLNPQTMTAIRNLRLNSTIHQGVSTGKNGVVNATLPFPLPAGTFNIHIRHGDKAKEMRLLPFSDYLHHTEKHISRNPMYYRKSAFISTEDSSVVSEAITISKQKGNGLLTQDRTTRNHDWTFYWDDIPRKCILTPL